MFAVVRLRGSVNVRKDIKDALIMLRLTRVNHCVIIPKDENYRGMLKMVKSYITWGEIDDKTLEMLIKKRGRLEGDKKLDEKKIKEVIAELKKNKTLSQIEGMKPILRLSPPSKGLKSIRRDFPRGDLGYRKENINELLKRMI